MVDSYTLAASSSSLLLPGMAARSLSYQLNLMVCSECSGQPVYPRRTHSPYTRPLTVYS